MIDELRDLEPFRDEVRSWFGRHVPADWREQQAGASPEQFAEFHRWWGSVLREGGYFAPHWPERWGGGGYSLLEQVVIAEELARADAPRNVLYQVSLYNAGPSILHSGTEEQKQRFLPPIIDGTVWCQGFSEPNAGSDLASLETRAVRDGEDYIVTGQKVWTSMALEADWCILLARTDSNAPKRKGITFLLMDMHSPGVEIRPIKQATGQFEFCETFMSEVRVPVENRLGSENDGWGVTNSTLASERGVVVLELAERLMRNGVGELIRSIGTWTSESGVPLVSDTCARELVAERYAEAAVLRQLVNTMIANIVGRGGVGNEASIVKLYYSELLQRLMNDAATLQGMEAQIVRPPLMSAGWESGEWLYDFINSYSWTIGGGTNEIMRNIIGERALGLPREPEVL
ncbi:MAG: acyl-CoA dehydrogenase family protein [Ilumatobacteraceae bacterium]|nr:acyl-CoA dehydrogenase family protein [Ilumatobacteraceae bacterium]